MCTLITAAVFALALAGAANATQPVFYGVAALGSKAEPVKFRATFGVFFLEYASKNKIECRSGTGEGEVTGPTTVKHYVITRTGCESVGLRCESAGEPEGTVVSFPLEGTLGNVTSTRPGLRLFAEGQAGKEPKNGLISEAVCGGGLGTIRTHGSLIGSFSGEHPTTVAEGKLPATLAMSYQGSSGKQQYQSFLPGECGGALECGPEQLTSLLNETSEPEDWAVPAKLVTSPFGAKLGVTK